MREVLRTVLITLSPGLFKGFVMSEAGYVASHVVYYSVYEICKQKLQEHYPPEQYGDANGTFPPGTSTFHFTNKYFKYL